MEQKPILLNIVFLFIAFNLCSSVLGFYDAVDEGSFWGQEAENVAQVPLKNTQNMLSDPLVGDDGRIYTCSERNVFSFESNGTVAWSVALNYTCNVDIAPVLDEKGKIYFVADKRVLKINPSNIGTSESAIEKIFGAGSDEIIGISISIWSSSLFINIKNRGLFAYTLTGQMLWSIGPVLYQSAYRQGCKENVKDCYFTSAPILDQCEGSIYIANVEGQLYSLSVLSPHFKWIHDFSALDKLFVVTPGNNGRLYLVFPRRSLVMALDVSTGNILWQNNVGPLCKGCSPVVDSNGWVSIGSLDGVLYSISPSGVLKKFLMANALYSVVQVRPVLDCSGYAIYVAQTRMEEKTSHTIGDYTSISALKPIDIIFTMLAPAAGAIYWSEKYPSQSFSLLLKSNLRHFTIDERILLAFVASAKMGKSLQSHTTRQKLTWSCSQAKHTYLSIYTGNERTIILFLLFQFFVLIVLAGFVHVCYIFWRKKKLQDHGLGKFLEVRHSLHIKKKSLRTSITEFEKKVAEEAVSDEVLEKLGDMVRERNRVERKLLTSYSLGRDERGLKPDSLLPLYNGKAKSYSFQNTNRESVTVFQTLSDTSSQETGNSISSSINSSSSGSSHSEANWYSCADKESAVKAKSAMEIEPSTSESLVRWEGKTSEESPSSPASGSKGYTNPLYIEHPSDDASSEMWLKRRSLSAKYPDKQAID